MSSLMNLVLACLVTASVLLSAGCKQQVAIPPAPEKAAPGEPAPRDKPVLEQNLPVKPSPAQRSQTTPESTPAIPQTKRGPTESGPM